MRGSPGTRLGCCWWDQVTTGSGIFSAFFAFQSHVLTPCFQVTFLPVYCNLRMNIYTTIVSYTTTVQYWWLQCYIEGSCSDHYSEQIFILHWSLVRFAHVWTLELARKLFNKCIHLNHSSEALCKALVWACLWICMTLY